MGRTGAGVPTPLVRAFLEELTREGHDLDRRRFLRQVAEAAAGPLAPVEATDASPSPDAAAATRVAVEDGVALAIAVLEPFDVEPPAAAEPEPPALPPPAPVPSGRSAARELARRARQQASQQVRRRVGRP